MRKAVWGAIALGIFALSVATPIREIQPLHRVLGLASLAGYLLLSFDPPTSDARQRKFLLAGIAAAVLAFLIAFAPLPAAVNVAARVLAVATVALPLWLVAGPARYAFVAAATIALFTAVPAVSEARGVATSVHAYVAAIGAFWVAAMMHNPTLVTLGERKPPRMVVASNIVTMSDSEKAAALERVEKRYRDGEIPEHKYWDLRQEIESR